MSVPSVDTSAVAPSSSNGTKSFFDLPFHRGHVTDNVEYYNSPHDTPLSLFNRSTCDDEDGKFSQGIRSVPDLTRNKLSVETSDGRKLARFLFGGFNDGRHVLKTISHAATAELQGDSGLRLEVVGVDICKYAVAKFVILWSLLEKMGSWEKGNNVVEGYDTTLPQDVLETTSLLSRIVSNAFLTQEDAKCLKSLMTKLEASEVCPVDCLSIAADQWQSLRTVYTYWLSDPWTTAQMMLRMDESGGEEDYMDAYLESMGMGGPMPAVAQMIGQFELMLAKPGLELEKTKIRGLIKKLRGMNHAQAENFTIVTEYVGMYDSKEHKEDVFGLNDKYQIMPDYEYGHSNNVLDYAPNPTLISEEWEFEQQINREAIQSVFQFLNLKEVEGHVRGSYSTMYYFTLIWLPVARAIKQLTDTQSLQVELFVGDMHTWARRNRTGAKFDRIHVSNIPDYTGLLACAVDFTNLLNPHCTFQHNILWAQSMWWAHSNGGGLSNFVYSSARTRSFAQFQKLFGWKVQNQDRVTVQDDVISWTMIPTSEQQASALLSDKEVILWSHELFLNVLMPAYRSLNQRQGPLNMVLYDFNGHALPYVFGAFSVLLQRGYSVELLAACLEPFLQPDRAALLQTKFPKESPPKPVYKAAKAQKVLTTPFAAEIRALGARWALEDAKTRSVFELALGGGDDVSAESIDCVAVRVPFKGAEYHSPMRLLRNSEALGRSGKPSGVYIRPQLRYVLGALVTTETEFANVNARQVSTGELRFSLCEFDISTQTVVVYMPRAQFQYLKTSSKPVSVVLYQTDTYDLLTTFVSFQDKATLVSESGNGEDKKTATTNALDITRVSWSQEEKRCLFCAGTGDGEEGDLLRCSRCKKVRFCDRQCQIQAWKTHKKSCKAELPSTQPIAKKSKIAK